MIDKNNGIKENERAVLVGVVQKEQKEHEVKEYLDELQFLAETAGAVTVKRFFQKLAHPDSKTFVGKGKLQEIADGVAVTRVTPGTRFVREWRGKIHVVTLTEDGRYCWQDREWTSLSMVARAITGTQWSGPAFFGTKTN